MPSTHAQDFSISKLQQKIDREGATTSMNRIINASANNKPTTSITHIGQDQQAPSTSISHPGSVVVGGDENLDEIRDRIRYQHIRQMMKEKKLAEASTSHGEEKSAYDISAQTGGAFKLKGKTGLVRKLTDMKYKYPLAYKHWHEKERDYVIDLVKPHAKGVGRGAGFDRLAKRSMKHKIEADRVKGHLSTVTANQMKKIVDTLN
jgi:hypothetical protein